MAQSWPDSLPNFGIDINDQQEDIYIRSETDVGPGKVRKRMTGRQRVISTSFIVTGAQRIILENLYNAESVFLKKDPKDDTEQLFRFLGSPQFSLQVPHENYLKRKWNVSLNLYKMP